MNERYNSLDIKQKWNVSLEVRSTFAVIAVLSLNLIQGLSFSLLSAGVFNVMA